MTRLFPDIQRGLGDKLVNPGDVFVKKQPSGDLVHIVLPKGPRARKTRYMRLNGCSIDATNWFQHWHFEARNFRYVGTLPAAALDFVWRNWTLTDYQPS